MAPVAAYARDREPRQMARKRHLPHLPSRAFGFLRRANTSSVRYTVPRSVERMLPRGTGKKPLGQMFPT